MGRQELEDEPVSLREVATLHPVEHERLRVPRRRGETDFELVRDSPPCEVLRVEAVSTQFALCDHIRKPQWAETSVPSPALTDRVLTHQLPVPVVEVVEVVILVARPRQVHQGAPVDVVHLRVGDPVRLDQPTELDQEILGEGFVAADGSGLGDEAEQPLGVASGKGCHSRPKDTTNDEWTPTPRRSSLWKPEEEVGFHAQTKASPRGTDRGGRGIDRADGTFGPASLVSELGGMTAAATAANDIQPNVRKDGREMVFSSDRSGTLGGQDVYVATRDSTADPWSASVNLGTAVNSGAGETRPSLSWHGEQLLFGRAGPVGTAEGGTGASDIYVTTREKNGD